MERGRMPVAALIGFEGYLGLCSGVKSFAEAVNGNVLNAVGLAVISALLFLGAIPHEYRKT